MSLGRVARETLLSVVRGARQSIPSSVSSLSATKSIDISGRDGMLIFRLIGGNIKRRWNSNTMLWNRSWSQAGYNNYGNGMIWSIIGINGGVYLLWKSNPLFCQRHFVLTNSSVYSRPYTLVTNAFSHPEFGNLAANMIALYFFGANVARLFGGKTVLGLYLAGSLASTLTHLYAHSSSSQPWGRFSSRDTPLYGARGSIQSIGTVSILMYPQQTILLYGIVPMPAALLLLLWVWNDLGGMLEYPSSPMKNAGNFMGIVTGALYYMSFRYRRRW